MGARLPPGEAARRAKERARATWSGERYNKIAAGDPAQWAAMAAAFIRGDVEFLNDAHGLANDPSRQRTTTDPWLIALDLDTMPTDLKTLKGAYRRAVMIAFRTTGFSDTAPAYVAAFMQCTKAYDRIRLQHGW